MSIDHRVIALEQAIRSYPSNVADTEAIVIRAKEFTRFLMDLSERELPKDTHDKE